MAGLSLSPQSGHPTDLAAAVLTDGNRVLVVVIAVVALAALVVAGVLVRQVLAAGEGTDSMKKIAAAVQEGANAYLARQLRTLAVFAVVVFFLLMLLPADDWNQRAGRSVFFLIGAAFSAATGYIGMWLAVRSNVRVAAAAREATPAAGEPEKDLTAVSHKAMKIAFRTGGVVGMFTVGLGLLGASCVVLVYAADAPKVLEGFGLGAALIAMFMRVGGGIFTKAADVGADLVGKVEQGIPEDDPRNAATIADNVGDCAGMAADLFESYAVTLVAALILGSAAFGDAGLGFPLLVPAIGVITAMIGIFAVAPRRADRSGMSAINRGFFISAAISLVLVAVAVFVYLPGKYSDLDGVTDAAITGKDGDPRVLALVAVAIGIVLAALIQQLTGYFTETTRRPVRDIGKSSLTGPATVVLAGISVGLESAVYTALLIGLGVYGAFLLGGTSIMLALFAVALAGTGLLTTVGVIVAMDTFGPVSDNAQGIAEMSGDVEGAGAQVLTNLDAVGNTTKAITKGIAIATAVLAAAALFGSYRDAIFTGARDVGEKLSGDGAPMSLMMDISQPNNLVGLVAGAAVVFLFSGLAINAVSRSAGSVVYEVRRQFREKPGIMDYSETPEYGKVVDICTKDALRELATPGLLAVMAPIFIGFTLGVGPLGAFLAGAIGAGTLMAVFLANSGGAWDNAKKLVEDGHHGGKGSEAHAATVIGDTVGDPFKDTAGPAINPLLKVMNLVSLLIAPAVIKFSYGADKSIGVRILVAALAFLVIVGAVYVSKRRGIAMGDEDNADAKPKSADPAVVS
jgi:K(+)-stimulated pyrophosphate-energized sodium pump